MPKDALSTNETLAEALRCLERGWAVAPIEAEGKGPHHAALKHTRGTTQANVLRKSPATADEVRAWFEYDPHANLGVLCGDPSNGLAVLDYDGGKIPPAGLLREHPVVVTGGGAHVYFTAEDGLRTKATGTKRGLERVKADGYVVGATSRHHSGTTYEWVRTPEETGLVTLQKEALETLLNLGLEAPRRAPIPSCTRTTRSNSLGAWDWEEDFVRAFCRLLEIPRLRGDFKCVLPGHTDHRASAAIWKAPDGQYLYKDFHKADKTYLLVHVYASVTTGRDISEVVEWPKPTLAQWKRRLIVELGFDTPAEVVMPSLPYGAPRSAVKVYEGVRDLYGVRWADGDESNPAPLTRKFLAPWCSMSEASVTLGKGFLIQHKIIEAVSKHGRTTLWLPGKEDLC